MVQNLISLDSKIKGRALPALLQLLSPTITNVNQASQKEQSSETCQGQFYGSSLTAMRGIFRDCLLHVICHSETEEKQKKLGELPPKSFQSRSCKHLLRGFGGIIPQSSQTSVPPALWNRFSIAHLGMCTACEKSTGAPHLPEVSTCVQACPGSGHPVFSELPRALGRNPPKYLHVFCFYSNKNIVMVCLA